MNVGADGHVRHHLALDADAGLGGARVLEVLVDDQRLRAGVRVDVEPERARDLRHLIGRQDGQLFEREVVQVDRR